MVQIYAAGATTGEQKVQTAISRLYCVFTPTTPIDNPSGILTLGEMIPAGNIIDLQLQAGSGRGKNILSRFPLAILAKLFGAGEGACNVVLNSSGKVTSILFEANIYKDDIAPPLNGADTLVFNLTASGGTWEIGGVEAEIIAEDGEAFTFETLTVKANNDVSFTPRGTIVFPNDATFSKTSLNFATQNSVNKDARDYKGLAMQDDDWTTTITPAALDNTFCIDLQLMEKFKLFAGGTECVTYLRW